MNKKLKMSIAIGVVVLAMALLFARGFKASGGVGMYLTIEEAMAVAQQDSDKFIQMEGLVINSTIKYDATKPELKFELTDDQDNKISVTYLDVKPDNLDSGYPVIVEGRFNNQKEFIADALKVKCPSKYEEETKTP